MKLESKILIHVMQPVLLGSICNIIINYIFNPQSPDFIFKEFLLAILFAVPITELNRVIDKRLNKKISWTKLPLKRFLSHLGLLSLTLLIVLNVVGNIYLLLIGDGFYQWNELLIINIVVFSVSLLLTLFQFIIFFYVKWRETEDFLVKSKKKTKQILSNTNKKNNDIELLKKNIKLRITIGDISFAKSEFNQVKVHFENDSAIYQNSLTALEKLLPKHLFFRASRSLIIHRETVRGIASSTYGKVDVILIDGETITISRLKASAFRKWYNSSLIVI